MAPRNYQKEETDQLNELTAKIEILAQRIPPEKSFLMQNVTTLLVALASAALIGLYGYVWSSNSSFTLATYKIEALSHQISDLSIKVDTMSNNYVQREDFNSLELRVRQLEIGKRSR